MTRYADYAARFGTPLFVYDLDEVAAARRELFAALPEEFELFYALKANPHPELVRALTDGDGRRCQAEISSTGELAAALAAGVDGSRCLYTGPGKTAGEIREAILHGVRRFSTDSVTDVARVGSVAVECGVEVDCALRINAASASSSTSIRMTGVPSQFGFDSETLADQMPLLRKVAGVRISGMHLFPMSNAPDEESLIAEFTNTVEFAAHLRRDLRLPLSFLDIGGGFAAPYAAKGTRGHYPKLRAALEALLDLHLAGWRDGEPRLACESGRFLVGTSGTMLAGVSNVKVSRGKKFVILDAGINTFGGMSGLGRLLPVTVDVESDEPTERADLVGPLCTPGDVLGRSAQVPELAAGDVITVPNTGAYGPTASLLMFLGRPSPTEVVVRGDELVSVSRIERERKYDPVAGEETR